MGGLSRKASERAAKSVISYTDQTPLNVQGLGSVTYDGNVPNLQLSGQGQFSAGLFGDLSNRSAYATRGLTSQAQGAAANLYGQGQRLMSQAGMFNPEQQAQTRFSRLSHILQPGRDRSQASLESRLLAQGRLDSSGGAAQLGEQQAAYANADAQMLDQMYQEAQNQRQQELQNANSLISQGGQLQGGLFSQSLMADTARQGQYTPLLGLLNTSQGLRQNEVNRRIAGSNAISGHNATMGGGGGGLGGALGTLAGGALGYFAGGGGATGMKTAMYGAQIGGGVGNIFGG